jgi:hypothetical protein
LTCFSKKGIILPVRQEAVIIINRNSITIKLIFVLILNLVLFQIGELCALKGITVYGNQDRGAVRLYTGWLHGFEVGDVYPVEKIRALNTSSWRICKWWQQEHVEQFTDNIQYEVSFSWRWYQYGNPAENLELWRDYIEYNVLYSVENQKHVEYWDIWNEPDHSYFWSWSYSDLLLTFSSAYETIIGLDPDAKVIGPSFAKFVARDNFDGRTVADFITDLYTEYGVLLDAVSWHMNDEWYPWNIQGHVDAVKVAIDNIGGGYDPKLVINEYTQSLIVLRPVYLASFVWHMDMAGIDFSNLACWNIYNRCYPPSIYSACWAGLNGLLLDDYSTEQHSYWFYKWHGEEAGNKRLVVSEPEYNTFALASKNDLREEIVVCVGKHSQQYPIEDVNIIVTEYPYASNVVKVEISVLPDEHQICDNNVWKPLQVAYPDGPVPVSVSMFPVVNGEVTIELQDFIDEDLYFIKIMQQHPHQARSYPFAPGRLFF